METVLQDIRYAIRGFRRNPVFTISEVKRSAVARAFLGSVTFIPAGKP